MPRINDIILEAVVYLYPSSGSPDGASGFIIAIPSEVYPERPYYYVATCVHELPGTSPSVRVNTTDGKSCTIETRRSEWTDHPGGDDIAILPLAFDLTGVCAIKESRLITHSIIVEHSIGPGDEVFLVGRFHVQEGTIRNTPTVRIGNIALMPHEPIYQPKRGTKQESFLVEIRSLSRYSGSPVWVYPAPWYPRPGQEMIHSRAIGPYLLGVDWGHIGEYKPVLYKDTGTQVNDEWGVEQNSGMAGVVPAWKLAELLHVQELEDKRKHEEKRRREEVQSSGIT